MRNHDHLRTQSVLLAFCLAAAAPAVNAAGTSTTTTTTTTIGTSTNVESKLSAEFATFLGGEVQAHAVVSGLRQGTAFSLETGTATAGTTGTTSTTTIDPPTGTMGYGNVRIALKLAQAQLNEFGITQPTAAELSAALLGGEINGTPVDGVLALRAEGMGWGQIALRYGTTVGQLMGKGGGLTKQPVAGAQAKTGFKAASASSSTVKLSQTSQSRSNGYIAS